MSIEQGVPEEKPYQIEPMAGMLLHRLMDLGDLLRKIDHEELPVKYYGGIPILPDGHDRKGNLRWGILKARSSTFIELVDEGFECEAKAVISFDAPQERFYSP